MVDDKSLACIKGEGTGVDVQLGVGWCLVRVRDAGEVLDDAFTGLLVESLGVSLLTNFERSTDVAFVEFKSCLGVNFPCEISILGVW